MKKVLSVLLFFVLVVTSFPLETSAAGLYFANCQLKCFTSGTPVQTAEGLKPIEKIKVGDLVLTKDETSGKIEYNPVVKLYQRETSDTYSITAKGITVTATGDHPFWVHNKGWVDAQHLKVGDRLQNAEGALYSIDRIEYKKGKAEVFNFQVQNVHNYFVTELGLWVHNCGHGGARGGSRYTPVVGGGGSSVKPSTSGTSSSVKKGEFSITNWNGYPSNGPKPQGPFRILEGKEYTNARKAANNANRTIHKQDPSLKGKQIHEIQPVKFGGSPTDVSNKIPLTPKEHAEYTRYWNNLQKNINKKP